MPRFPVILHAPGSQQNPPAGRVSVRPGRNAGWRTRCLLLSLVLLANFRVHAVVLWNDPGPILVRENGAGTDILGGAVKRDESANDTLYFKFHVEPLSDKDTEPYHAGFELFEGGAEHMGIGNSLEAWAYSAYFPAGPAAESNSPDAYLDLHTTRPESPSSASYQYPRHGVGATIVFKIQYIPGEDDLVTVWLNPDLGPGANEVYQPEGLTTRFNANARFDEIRLRHGGGGDGWQFSDLAVATSFTDFVDVSSARPNDETGSALGGIRAINFQAWQKEQGLPSGPVHAVMRTHDGYLWLGNDDGLVRFDGTRFVHFGAQEGLKCGRVSTLLEDQAGALWIGSATRGLYVWQNGRINSFTTNNGLSASSITALASDTENRTWVGTSSGLVMFQDGKPLPAKGAGTFQGHSIASIQQGAQGTMWVGVKGLGVFWFTNDSFAPLRDPDAVNTFKDVQSLLVDPRGRLWIWADADFVVCVEGGHFHRYRVPHPRSSSGPGTLAPGLDETVWVGAGAAGLMQIRDGKSFMIPMGASLAGRSVESLYADNEGRLWAGTDAGLDCVTRKSLFALSQGEGLGFGAVQSLMEATPGVVWAAKSRDGLYRWDGKSFSRLSADELSTHGAQITSMLVTRDGFCWVATANGLWLYRDPIAAGDEVRRIEFAPSNILAMAEDLNGAVWMGTRDGKIRQLSENQWIEPKDFSQNNPVTALALGADGSMWVGTDGGGLYRFTKGTAVHFEKKDGLASDFIRTLYLDGQGTLWIGTADGGLGRWRYGRLAGFTMRDGLPDNSVRQILEDDLGRLWLGTGHGIACLSKRRLDDVASGESTSAYPKLFGLSDGMLSEECTGGFYPAGLKTKSGLLWFSTSKGVGVIDPHAVPETTEPPRAVLEQVLVDGVTQRITRKPFADTMPQLDRLNVTPGKHSIEIRYTGLGFDQPELIRFRYQLEGVDAGWVDANTRLSAFYSYLPPGDYEFHLAACSANGAWNENSHALEVVVQRHLWQNWWFMAAAAAAVLVLVGGIVRAVVRGKMQRRLKRLEQEHALERERTRIAQDLHDEMGAKLCRISFLSEHARRGELPAGELRDQITSISDASREVLHSLDEIVWAVNPQNDTLEHVASYISQYAEDYFNMTGVQCELEIPEQLPPHPLSSQQRHNLFLATHEAFTNILKHSRASRASVSMALAPNGFVIDIKDNGQGFDPEAIKARKEPATTGDGLNNMARRLEAVGGSCKIESSPGKGTHIKFVVFVTALTKNNHQ